MAIKNQLQFALFNGSYYFVDKNGTQAKVTDNEDYIKNFAVILENLETLSSILQDIQVLNIYMHSDFNICSYLNIIFTLASYSFSHDFKGI